MGQVAASAGIAATAWLLATSAHGAGNPPQPPPTPDLPYEVVDGLAIHAGDIVLGPAEAFERSGPTRAGPLRGLTPRELALPQHGATLWPHGVVPYVIDEALPAEAVENTLAAIDEWNSRTVISLVPRTVEEDFIRFVPAPAASACSSYVGRFGGEQRLNSTVGGRPCTREAMIHEIGHAVGLSHEHQRSDRDERLVIHDSALHGRGAGQVAPSSLPDRPYDYGSVMHYNPPTFETIPPGIEIDDYGRLSEGDIDGVARLYGHTPTATVIATHPPGLEVVVDGIATTAPARFEWEPGTEHTLEVAARPQVRPGSRYLFARWNDGEPRVRTVTASADRTWIEAHFITQRAVTVAASPAGWGEVLATPETDGWVTLRAPVRIEARTRPGTLVSFWRWNRWYPHGLAENPAPLVAGTGPLDVVGYFTFPAAFRIGSNAGPFTLYLDGRWHRAPTALLRSQAPVAARVPETQRIRYAGGRYRFAGWSDGMEVPERTIDPSRGGTLDVLLATEWPLEVVRRPPHGGSVLADPPSPDWHYADGSETTVTAVPSAGWEFAGWSGDVAGGATATALLDRPLAADAWFTRTRELRSGEPVAIASPAAHGYRFRAGTAAELVLAFTPAPGSAPAALCVRAIHGPLEHAAQSWDRLFSAGSIREQRRSEADFVAEAAVPGQAATITISRESDPPLDPAALYFVTLAHSRSGVAGTLGLEASGTAVHPPAGRAWPRAFTFVADVGTDPPAQSFELTNEGGSAMRWEASAEAAWLAADPPQGAVPPGGTAQVAVRVTGVVPADTHEGTLALELSGPAGAVAPLALPVTFVAVPPPDVNGSGRM